MDKDQRPARRVRVEQGIYLQPNGKYAVFMAAQKGCGEYRFSCIEV